MATIVYPIIYTAADARSYSFRAQLPIKYVCPIIPPGFNTDPNSLWNCTRCGSAREFYQPFERGDIIPFQTSFEDNYNNPNDVLNAGIRGLISSVNYYVEIELLDGDGTLVSNIADDFCSDYWVGYDAEFGSLQTWFVNTGLFPSNLKCFSLKITYYKIDQTSGLPAIERVIYTEQFRENVSCRSTVAIQSSYANTDCNGNFYGFVTNFLGTNNPVFYNFIRIFGSVDYVGEAEERETNDRGVVLRQTIIKEYKIISGLYPEFYVQRLSQTVRGNAIFVDGVEYKDFEFPNKPDDHRMFELDLTFNTECLLDNRNCNF
jgi:hypothetical protein